MLKDIKIIISKILMTYNFWIFIKYDMEQIYSKHDEEYHKKKTKTILKKSFSKKWKFMNKEIESLENMGNNDFEENAKLKKKI